MKAIVIAMLCLPMVLWADDYDVAAFTNPLVAGRWRSGVIASGGTFSMYREMEFDQASSTMTMSHICRFGTVEVIAETKAIPVSVNSTVIEILDSDAVEAKDPGTNYVCQVSVDASKHRYIINNRGLRFFASEAPNARYLDFKRL